MSNEHQLSSFELIVQSMGAVTRRLNRIRRELIDTGRLAANAIEVSSSIPGHGGAAIHADLTITLADDKVLLSELGVISNDGVVSLEAFFGEAGDVPPPAKWTAYREGITDLKEVVAAVEELSLQIEGFWRVELDLAAARP